MPCQLATFFEENFSSLALVFSQEKENGKKENTNFFFIQFKDNDDNKKWKKKNYASCGDLGGGGDYPHIIMRTLVHIFIFESSSPLVLARI